MWVTEPILNKDFNNNSNYKSFDRLKDKVVGTVSVSEVMFMKENFLVAHTIKAVLESGLWTSR